MRARMTTVAIVAAWLLCGAPGVAASPQAWPDSQAITRFQRAVDTYAFEHRRVERRLPRLDVTADPVTVTRAIEGMASAMRAIRGEADEGELFEPIVAQIIRNRVVKALRHNGLDVADLLPHDVQPAAVALRVNDTMPWRVSGAMPAAILAVLPALPPELQYRFVGADLLLIDIHAALIVDILRDAAVPIDTIR